MRFAWLPNKYHSISTLHGKDPYNEPYTQGTLKPYPLKVPKKWVAGLGFQVREEPEERPAKSLKEGQEKQETLKVPDASPLTPLPLPGPPGLPSGFLLVSQELHRTKLRKALL